jgi:hypothetical protein
MYNYKVRTMETSRYIKILWRIAHPGEEICNMLQFCNQEKNKGLTIAL